MNTKIKWIRENPGAPREDGSYYHSAEGRFEISPTFRGRSWPDGYVLSDTHGHERYGYPLNLKDDSIRSLKVEAERRVIRENEDRQ